MLEFKTGDLFTTKCEAIGHGVNLVPVAGKGIALEIRKRYPKSYKEYMAVVRDGRLSVGGVHVVHCDDKIILNMATQKDIRRGLTGGARYPWIRQCLQNVADNWQVHGFASVAFPKVGCSLGGLLWIQVKPIFKEIFTDSELKVEVYE